MSRDKDVPYYSVSVAEISDYLKELGFPVIYVNYNDGREEIHFAADNVLHQLGNVTLKFKENHGACMETTMRTTIACSAAPVRKPREDRSPLVTTPTKGETAKKTVAVDTSPLKPALPFTKGT